MEHDATQDGFGRPAEDAELYRRIFERANDAIFLIDVERDAILDVNDKACRLLEYSREELLVLPISATHPDDIAGMREFVRSVLDQGSGWTNELTCETKFGRRVPAKRHLEGPGMRRRPCQGEQRCCDDGFCAHSFLRIG